MIFIKLEKIRLIECDRRIVGIVFIRFCILRKEENPLLLSKIIIAKRVIIFNGRNLSSSLITEHRNSASQREIALHDTIPGVQPLQDRKSAVSGKIADSQRV